MEPLDGEQKEERIEKDYEASFRGGFKKKKNQTLHHRCYRLREGKGKVRRETKKGVKKGDGLKDQRRNWGRKNRLSEVGEVLKLRSRSNGRRIRGRRGSRRKKGRGKNWRRREEEKDKGSKPLYLCNERSSPDLENCLGNHPFLP